ncbi:MAG: bifunctional phosphoribosyl-AMP cyclohydrolase/phosphoribosyl-ATP diphosphatase HisIE [Gammaproteobacteria bacterium]
MQFNFEKINWDKTNNLLPVIIQNAQTGVVLMLGYMNPEALQKTLAENIVTFYSRTKERLWTKGETSGNFLKVLSISQDCDEDTLLILVDPIGPTCHQGTESCFVNDYQSDWSFIQNLEKLLIEREQIRPEGSYTTTLFNAGINRVAQKVGEEGVEVALAAVVKDDQELCGEAADLLFHLLVLLRVRGLSLHDVITLLKDRAK